MNVAGAIVMGGGTAFRSTLRETTGYVFPFYTPNTAAYDEAALTQMRKTIESSPEWRGIGEVLARHGSRNIKRPPDDPGILKILDYAGQRGLIVNIHHEPRNAPGGIDEGLAEMERALTTAPGVAVIWAHGAATGPTQIAPFLSTFPNLYVDLSNRWKPGASPSWLEDEDGQLKLGWRTVLEAFPDRFLFGSDFVPDSPGNSPEGPNAGEVPGIVANDRARLAQLTPATAERIGALNARRLLKLS